MMSLPAPPQKEWGGGGEGEVEAVLAVGSRGGARCSSPAGGCGHGDSGLLAPRWTVVQTSATGGRCDGLSVIHQLHTCIYSGEIQLQEPDRTKRPPLEVNLNPDAAVWNQICLFLGRREGGGAPERRGKRRRGRSWQHFERDGNHQ